MLACMSGEWSRLGRGLDPELAGAPSPESGARKQQSGSRFCMHFRKIRVRNVDATHARQVNGLVGAD
ncbi:hypothetical protein L1887_51468 [Cichorium endivia]|nr:hypothetical protein L1887_51468 [Cichorium endivia]